MAVVCLYLCLCVYVRVLRRESLRHDEPQVAFAMIVYTTAGIIITSRSRAFRRCHLGRREYVRKARRLTPPPLPLPPVSGCRAERARFNWTWRRDASVTASCAMQREEVFYS